MTKTDVESQSTKECRELKNQKLNLRRRNSSSTHDPVSHTFPIILERNKRATPIWRNDYSLSGFPARKPPPRLRNNAAYEQVSSVASQRKAWWWQIGLSPRQKMVASVNITVNTFEFRAAWRWLTASWESSGGIVAPLGLHVRGRGVPQSTTRARRGRRGRGKGLEGGESMFGTLRVCVQTDWYGFPNKMSRDSEFLTRLRPQRDWMDVRGTPLVAP